MSYGIHNSFYLIMHYMESHDLLLHSFYKFKEDLDFDGLVEFVDFCLADL